MSRFHPACRYKLPSASQLMITESPGFIKATPGWSSDELPPGCFHLCAVPQASFSGDFIDLTLPVNVFSLFASILCAIFQSVKGFLKKFLRCCFYTVYKGDECVGKEPCRAQRLRECVARRAELAKKRALRLVLVKPLGAKIDVAAEAGCGAV